MAASWKRAALGVIHGGHVAWRSLRRRVLHQRGDTRLAVLMYHGVVEEPLTPACWHQLPLARFDEQMRFLAKTCHVLPIEEALERMAQGTLPHRACAITFDDGFRNNLTTAAPVLEALGLPATIFLVTGAMEARATLWPDTLYLALRATDARTLDAAALGLGTLALHDDDTKAAAAQALLRVLKARPTAEKNAQLARLLADLTAGETPAPGAFELLTWEDVATLAQSGITFGAHTTHHEILSRLLDEDVATTIRTSHEEVTRRRGRAPRVFAYPNGRAIDFDERAKRALREADIPWALSTEEGLARRGADPLAVRRLGIGADLSFPRFRQLVAGTIDLLKRR